MPFQYCTEVVSNAVYSQNLEKLCKCLTIDNRHNKISGLFIFCFVLAKFKCVREKSYNRFKNRFCMHVDVDNKCIFSFLI